MQWYLECLPVPACDVIIVLPYLPYFRVLHNKAPNTCTPWAANKCFSCFNRLSPRTTSRLGPDYYSSLLGRRVCPWMASANCTAVTGPRSSPSSRGAVRIPCRGPTPGESTTNFTISLRAISVEHTSARSLLCPPSMLGLKSFYYKNSNLQP